MNEKQLIATITDFIRLNPKRNRFSSWREYNSQSFHAVQSIMKNQINVIKFHTYNNVFYNKKNNKKLMGQDYINILLTSENIKEYNKRIRINYPNCRKKKLRELLIYDVFNWYSYNKEQVVIDEVEFGFSEQIKTELRKIKELLKEKDWSYYFFSLQKLMHNTIIEALEWREGKNLNFNSYSKVLKKYLANNLEEQEELLSQIVTINLYRNTFSKAVVGAASSHQELYDKWTQFTELQKTIKAWELYYILIKFIHIIILIKNNKEI